MRKPENSHIPSRQMNCPKKRKLKRQRRFFIEQLESRQVLASDWQNPLFAMDVGNDENVSPLDVLVLINEINSRGARSLPTQRPIDSSYLDVDGDNSLSPLDVLNVVNFINRGHANLNLEIKLADDTGESSMDLLTRDGRVQGDVLGNHGEIVEARIRFGDGMVFSLPKNASGNFLSARPFYPDGPIHSKVFIQDEFGAFGFATMDYLLDTNPPTKPSPELARASDSLPLSDHLTTIDTVTIVGQTDVDATVEWTGASGTLETDGLGGYSIVDAFLRAGSTAFTIRAKDPAGNIAETTSSFYRPPSSISLSENVDRVSRVEVPLTLEAMQGVRSLNFEIAATAPHTPFGPSSNSSFPDTFSVYLVDANGKTLLDRGVAGTPFFSITERGPSTAPNTPEVTINGDRISVDLSALRASEAKLVFELFNGDSDLNWQVNVTSVSMSINATAEPEFRVPVRSPIIEPGPAIDRTRVELNFDSLDGLFDNFRIDPATNIFTVDARVHNKGVVTAGRDLVMILGGLPVGMTLLNRSGDDPLGPYVNFSSAIPEMGLPSGADTDRIPLRFHVDDLTSFEFNPVLDFLARSNALELFEEVYNANDFQPYRGAMKGIDGIRDTKAGNAWDQSSLLIDNLRKSGQRAEYMFGRIEIPVTDAMDWIGATTPAGAVLILQNAGLNPTAITQDFGGGPVTTAIQLDHAWVQTRKFLPGSPVINLQLDPSLKPCLRQAGIPDISTLVPFDETTFFSSLQIDQPQDDYVDKVAEYLRVNHPGKSLSDVPIFGGTKPRRFRELPTLPFAVVSPPVTRESIPYEETARVIMTFDNLHSAGGAISLQHEFHMPTESHSRTVITWRQESLFLSIPELRIDGRLVASGSPMPNSDTFRINIQKYHAGDLQMDHLTAFNFPVGKVFAIGFNVGQIGRQLLTEQRSAINAAGADYLAGRPIDFDEQVGALLSLTALTYWDNTSRAKEMLAALTEGQRVYNFIESGFAQLDSPSISYFPDLPIIAVPDRVVVNIPQPSLDVINMDGSTIAGTSINDPTRDRLIKLLSSTEEHRVLEQLFNFEAISGVKVIQYANANNIPVFTIDQTNKEEFFPQLELPAAFESDIEFYIDNGVTVITPKRTIEVGRFNGAGYLIQNAGGFFGALVGRAFGAEPTNGPFPDEPEECRCPTPEDFSPGDGQRGPTKGNQFEESTGYLISIPDPPPPPAGGDIIKGLSPAGPGDVKPAKTQFQGVALNDGALIRENSDVDLPNIGIPLLFTRRYDSQFELDVGFGEGWTHTYAHHLEVGPPDTRITWVTDTGRRYEFEPNLESPNVGDYISPRSLTGKLEHNDEGFYIYSMPDGTRYDFAADGNLLVIFDRHNYGVILNYDNATPPRLHSVVSNADRTRGFELAYNSDNQIVKLTESTGRSWDYSYDRDTKLLARAKHTAQRTSSSQPTPQDWNYSYFDQDDDGPVGLLKSIHDAKGDVETYSYYPNRMLMQYRESSGGIGSYVYELENRRTIFTNEEGVVTTYTYQSDGLYQSIQRVTPGGFANTSYFTWNRERLASKIDFNGHSTANYFDDNMNIIQRIEADGTSTSYTYGPLNTRTSMIDSLGRTTTYSYDFRGDLIREVDPIGNVTTHTYDLQGRGLRDSTTWPNGNLTSNPDDYKSQFAYNIAGQVILVANDLPSLETYEYDVFGNLVRETDSLGRSYTYSYDSLDRRIAQVDPMGQERRYNYDRIGDLVMVTDELNRKMAFRNDYTNLTKTTVHADGTSMREAFDLRGNRVNIRDENGNITKFYYDVRDRLIETQFPDGTREFRTYDGERNLASVTDPKGNTTKYTYDKRDRLVSETDALGGVTRFEYDLVGNLIKITDPLNRVSSIEYDRLDRPRKHTNAIGESIVTAYDANGNVLTSTDPAGNVSSYVHDVANRPIKSIDPLNHATTLVYDSVGNILSNTDENGHSTFYEYDILNRSVAEIDAKGQRSEDKLDAVGRVTHRRDRLGHTTSFAYDLRDRLLVATDAIGAARTYVFDNAGNVRAFTDELGRTIHYEYDSMHRRTSVTDPLGGRQTFFYDASGNMSSRSDELGRITQFGFDALNRLVSTTDPLSGVWTSTYDAVGNALTQTDALGRVTQYVYDGLDRIVTITDPLSVVVTTTYDNRGNITGSTDQLGRMTTYTYDSLNRLTSTTNPDSGIVLSTYDPAGNLTAATDERGNVTRFEYDQLNRLVATTDAIGGVWTTSFDAEGNLLTSVDANGHATTLEYDPKNRLIRSRDAIGGVMESTYDATNNLIESRDQLGRRTRYTYDALNRLVETTNALRGTRKTTYDAVGNVLSTADELEHKTRFTYDALNRVIRTRDALDQITSMTYDAVGNMLTVRDPLDRTTRYRYDALDRLVQVRDALDGTVQFTYDAVGNIKSQTDPLDREIRFQYDTLDRLVKTTDPMGFMTTNDYDAFGNLRGSTDSLGRETRFVYDKLNRLTSQTDALGGIRKNSYDAVGNVVSTTDELNRTSRQNYDEVNRKVESIDPLGQPTKFEYDLVDNLLAVTDPLEHATSYAYDELNRLVSVIDPTGAANSYSYDPAHRLTIFFDPSGNGTYYGYDELNRVIVETNSIGGTREFQYDAQGNTIGRTDRKGRKTRYSIDALNRPTKEEWLDATGNAIRSFNWTYDAASQLLSATDPDSNIQMAYDANGRLTDYSIAAMHSVPAIAFGYTYDSVGNQLTRGTLVGGSLDAENNYQYDALNRPTRITQSGTNVVSKRIDMSYDAASQPIGLDRFADLAGTRPVVQTTRTYDANSRTTGIQHAHAGTTLAAYGITYDAASRITKIESPDGPKTFQYDARNQLVQADHTGQSDENYTYDANGNRTNAGYTTARDNRLKSDGVFNYEYDAEGNRIKRTTIASGEIQEYTWDYRNRLTSVVARQSASGPVTSVSLYTYDSFDNRTGKSVDSDGPGPTPAVETRYVVENKHIALKFDGASNRTHRYLHGPTVDQVLADETVGGGVLWPLADQVGSVRDLVDSNGAIANHIQYDSFGNRVAESNAAVDHLFGYTGRELDDESGLMFYRARYYDPAIGRFVSQDPLSFAAGDANLYRYVENNPITMVDPSGLGGEDCDLVELLKKALKGFVEHNEGGEIAKQEKLELANESIKNAGPSTAKQYPGHDSTKNSPVVVTPPPPTNNGGGDDGGTPGDSFKPTIAPASNGGNASPNPKPQKQWRSLVGSRIRAGGDYDITGINGEPIDSEIRGLTKEEITGLKPPVKSPPTAIEEIFSGKTLSRALEMNSRTRLANKLVDLQSVLEVPKIADGLSNVKNISKNNAKKAAIPDTTLYKPQPTTSSKNPGAIVPSPPISKPGIHPGKAAAESSEVTRESVLRYLRRTGNQRNVITAKLISKNKAIMHVKEKSPEPGVRGQQFMGTNVFEVYKEGSPTIERAANTAVHETQHVMDKVTPANYNVEHEIRAMKAERDGGSLVSDGKPMTDIMIGIDAAMRYLHLDWH